jgi:hypothetical protein
MVLGANFCRKKITPLRGRWPYNHPTPQLWININIGNPDKKIKGKYCDFLILGVATKQKKDN